MTDLWEVLGGRAVGTVTAPDDQDLWDDVRARLSVARARPRLRAGVEAVARVSVRGQPYVMLRSPDRMASYVRLAPEEWDLAQEMDGAKSVAALVGVMGRATGTLAPDRVTRVVADLASNRMLEELPIDAFAGVATVRAGPPLRRAMSRLSSAARGKRLVLGDADRAMGALYRFGGRLLFTRPFALVAGLVAVVGLGIFVRAWATGATSLFLTSGSYAVGGLTLLALNVFALLAHELGHGLGTKHAGRRVPAVGLLFYFGIPSAFVDTTDIWMAERKHRLIATAAGPASALTLAGVAQITAAINPELAPLAFKLSFAWYLNALFNLNPLMALDGYYLAMDALEIANLRSRGMAFVVNGIRRRRFKLSGLDREDRYVAAYGVASMLWSLAFLGLSVRMWRDRISGLLAGLWHTGPFGKALVILFLLGLFGPVWALARRLAAKRVARVREALVRRRIDADRPTRRAAVHASVLAGLPADRVESLVEHGRLVVGHAVASGAALDQVQLVVEGGFEGRRPMDAPATVRERLGVGQVLGIREAATSGTFNLAWRPGPEGARVVAFPASTFVDVVGPYLHDPKEDSAQARQALEESPALATLGQDAQRQFLATMRSVALPPGKAITLKQPEHALLVASGVVEHDGGQVRAGEVVRIDDVDQPVRVVTRTSSVLWKLPNFASLAVPAVLAGVGPSVGVHGAGGGPPSIVPTPSSMPEGDDEAEERLWRRTRWILILLALFALLSVASNLAEPTAWAEVASDRVMVEADGTSLTIRWQGSRPDRPPIVLRSGQRATLGEGDVVEVGRDGQAVLTASGGARSWLCGGSVADMTTIADAPTVPGRFAPSLGFELRGVVLADTTSRSPVHDDLRLAVTTPGLALHTIGRTAFGATGTRVDVVSGQVDVSPGHAVTTLAVGCGGYGRGGSAELSLATLEVSPTGVAQGQPSPRDSTATTPSDGGADVDPTPGPSSTQTSDPRPTPTPTGPPSASPTAAGPSPTATPTTPPTVTPTPSSSPTTSPTPTPSPTPSPTATPSPTPTASPTPSPTPMPDLDWACTPTQVAMEQGQSRQVRCTVTSTDFAGTVHFSCADVPNGVGCSTSPTQAAITDGSSASTTVTISAGASSPIGTFTISAVVTSASGAMQRSEPIDVTVTAAPSPSIRWTCASRSLSAAPGGTARTTCDVTSVDGFEGTVQLACQPPAELNATCQFQDGSGSAVRTVTLGAGQTAKLTVIIQVGTSAPPGSHTVPVRATADGVTKTVSLVVTVS